VDAIFKDIDMPAEHKASIDFNAAFFRQNKAISLTLEFGQVLGDLPLRD
jgi:hypothetical protein